MSEDPLEYTGPACPGETDPPTCSCPCEGCRHHCFAHQPNPDVTDVAAAHGTSEHTWVPALDGDNEPLGYRHCGVCGTPRDGTAEISDDGVNDTREAQCTCGETACESELCDCDAVPCPVNHAVDNTRDQLAAALYDTYGQRDRHRSNAIADAAMSVVGPKLEALRAELKETYEENQRFTGMLAQRDAENARLRAELDEWEATYGRDALPGALRQLEQAEKDSATIERVRSMLDAADLNDRETGFYMDVCAALEGEQS